MKIVTFNVNGIRVRRHQLEELIRKHSPEVICLQETKVRDEEFPAEMIKELGYSVEYYGQKTHYGVAIMSKRPLENTVKGFPFNEEGQQRRFIAADYVEGKHRIHIINGYFPQGENREHAVKFPAKAKYYEDLNKYMASLPDDIDVVVTGDMNIAPTDFDLGIGEDNVKRWLREGKTSFLPEEREWFEKLMSYPLVDVYRVTAGDSADYFSWFDYRSKGFERDPKRGLRIDHILTNKALAEKLTDAGIDYDVRGMNKPSDHAPVWAEFDL